jgi:hypothetical protein
MFDIIESWALDSRNDDLLEEPTTSAVVDWIGLDLERLRGY